MLNIENLYAGVEGKTILNGVNLHIPKGEIHVLMGSNGSGKSTLAHVLAGHDEISRRSGRILLDGEEISLLPCAERAQRGLFLGFQTPPELPGVNNVYLLKAAVNARRRFLGQQELDALAFLEQAKMALADLHLPEHFLSRSVNEGFSGGERKRNEILHMTLLQPRMVVLDEIDSGLDVDALGAVAEAILALRAPTRAMLLITHHTRLLELLAADRVHIMRAGRIVESGSAALAARVLAQGFVSGEVQPLHTAERVPA